MTTSSIAMQPRTAFYRWLALSANLALLVWILLWQLTLSPHPHLNPTALAIGWVIPLLLPLFGILKGKPYTMLGQTLF